MDAFLILHHAATGSKSYEHGKWIDDESDFPDEPRTVFLFFHNDGKDALGVTQVGLIFDVVEGIQALDKYDNVCQNTTYTHPKTNETTCRVSGGTFSKIVYCLAVRSPNLLSNATVLFLLTFMKKFFISGMKIEPSLTKILVF